MFYAFVMHAGINNFYGYNATYYMVWKLCFVL